MKYEVGMIVNFKEVNIKGTIVENYKMPGDICIDWDNGTQSSYDEEFLDEKVEIVKNKGN